MKRFASVILSVVIIFGSIQAYVLYRDSSPTPIEAVRNHITRITTESHSPQKIEALNIVLSIPSGRETNEQLLLFQANDSGLEIHIAGYAIVKKSLFGWYIDNFQMTGKSPLPDDVMAGLSQSYSTPIIYGQVFLADAASIEAIFSDPNQGTVTISANITKGNFAVFGTRYSELTVLKLLDSNGNILKQLTKDELQNG